MSSTHAVKKNTLTPSIHFVSSASKASHDKSRQSQPSTHREPHNIVSSSTSETHTATPNKVSTRSISIHDIALLSAKCTGAHTINPPGKLPLDVPCDQKRLDEMFPCERHSQLLTCPDNMATGSVSPHENQLDSSTCEMDHTDEVGSDCDVDFSCQYDSDCSFNSRIHSDTRSSSSESSTEIPDSEILPPSERECTAKYSNCPDTSTSFSESSTEMSDSELSSPSNHECSAEQSIVHCLFH